MTYLVTLPGVFLDAVTGAAFTGLIVANEVPERDSIEAPRAKSVTLQILNTLGHAVDLAATQVYVDGELAYDGGAGANGWAVLGPSIDGIIDDWDMEEVGVASWSVLGGVAPKEAGSPGGTGTQVLRLTDDTGFGGVVESVSATLADVWYRVNLWYRTSAAGVAVFSTDVRQLHRLPTAVNWTQVEVITKNSAAAHLYLLGGGAIGEWAEFDDVVVEPLSDPSISIAKIGEEWDSEHVTTVRVVSASRVEVGLYDGNMESGNVDFWTMVGATKAIKWTVAVEGATSINVHCLSTDPHGPYAIYQTVLATGTTYRIHGWAFSDAANVGSVYVLAGGGGGPVILWTSSVPGWEEFDETFVAPGGIIGLGFQWAGAAGGETALFDGVTIEAIPTASYSLDETYSFTVEDYVAPTIVSASAPGPSTVRVTFSEAMKAVSATGADDALNPSRYALGYIQTEDGIAAVAATVTAVTQVSASVYDLTTSQPLTFGKTYEVTALGVADDSAAGNVVIAPLHSAQFLSWSPPDWPTRRSFDFYQMFSAADRRKDVTLDLKKLCSLYQDIIDQSLWRVDWFWRIWDTSLSPEAHLRALLADHGNPFTLDITVAQQRKLLDLLVPIYQQKGTKEGIVNLARLFVGLDITDIVVPMEDTWILGDEEYGILGETTILAPANSAARYSFWIVVSRALTSAERVMLDEIVRKMKCAHEHAYVLEPTDPELIDHWELGLSYLGDNTYLH